MTKFKMVAIRQTEYPPICCGEAKKSAQPFNAIMVAEWFPLLTNHIAGWSAFNTKVSGTYTYILFRIFWYLRFLSWKLKLPSQLHHEASILTTLVSNVCCKWNESGFRPPLCTYRLNWARKTSWGWWDDWDDIVRQTQDSEFGPWRSEDEHTTFRSRRLPTILTQTFVVIMFHHTKIEI